LAAQPAQTPPEVPHALVAVPTRQVPVVAAEQQPVLHGVALSQAALQRCVVALHAVCTGQSDVWLQPQNVVALAVTQAVPLTFAAQVVQVGAAVVTAHEVWAVPALHVPLFAAEQHPPLQALAEPQAVPQTPPTQALPDGQSVAAEQPQVPVLVVQTLPVVPLVQSTHALPGNPQAVLPTVAHLLVASQQKAPVQRPVVPCVVQVEVQVPPEQVGVPRLQPTHAPPALPHLLLSLPATQLLPSQQPLLQALKVPASVPPQTALQVCVDMLHALPAGQSVAALQPQAMATHAWPLGELVQLTH